MRSERLRPVTCSPVPRTGCARDLSTAFWRGTDFFAMKSGTTVGRDRSIPVLQIFGGEVWEAPATSVVGVYRIWALEIGRLRARQRQLLREIRQWIFVAVGAIEQ